MSPPALDATATERIFARIGRPLARAYSSVVTSTAAAPSVSGEEVPAVTVPSAVKAGFRPDSPSAVVPGRMQPSLSTRPAGVWMPTISSAMRPAAWASAALAWEATASASCSAREMAYLRATFSAVMPIEQ